MMLSSEQLQQVARLLYWCQTELAREGKTSTADECGKAGRLLISEAVERDLAKPTGTSSTQGVV